MLYKNEWQKKICKVFFILITVAVRHFSYIYYYSTYL